MIERTPKTELWEQKYLENPDKPQTRQEKNFAIIRTQRNDLLR